MGYSGEASSDVYRFADLVATRLASKHLKYARTPTSIVKAMQTQRICRTWGHSFACGFARVVLDRVRENLDPAPGSRNWGSELDADAKFNFLYPLVSPEELQLNHNHEKFLFLTVLLLCAQCKMHYW
jgi:hypothetical protein